METIELSKSEARSIVRDYELNEAALAEARAKGSKAKRELDQLLVASQAVRARLPAALAALDRYENQE